MDMKDIFENGCFTPAWIEPDEEFEHPALRDRKNLSVLLDELDEIKNNIENLQAKSWYLERLRQYHEHGLSKS